MSTSSVEVSQVKPIAKELPVEVGRFNTFFNNSLYYMSVTLYQANLDKKFTAAVLNGDLGEARTKIVQGSKNHLDKDSILALAEKHNDKEFQRIMNFLIAQIKSFKINVQSKRNYYYYMPWSSAPQVYYYEDNAVKGIAGAYQTLRDKRSNKADIINGLYTTYKMNNDPYELQII